jgi:hypothetical protein
MPSRDANVCALLCVTVLLTNLEIQTTLNRDQDYIETGCQQNETNVTRIFA